MAFKYLTNIPLDQAIKEYLTCIRNEGREPRTERIAVAKACGRVTARAVYAELCAPHYNSSAMDGIAINAADTFGATETTPAIIKEGCFVRVDTGDPLPDGCDCVVMIEDVIENPDRSVTLYSAAAPWQHVRQIGEDICAGEMIIPSFTKISASAAGAMLAGGVIEVEVICKPIIGIIPTGDEIVPPTKTPQAGEIIEFNSTIFSGMLMEWGAIPKAYGIVADRREEIENTLAAAVSECDAVILNAGSSAGREDFSSAAIEKVGRVICHGIAIKPGKPAILGIGDGKPIIGVPGYPVSGIIVLEQIFRAVVAQLSGGADYNEETVVRAVASRKINSSLKYREFIRTRLGLVGNKLVAVPLNRGAGVVSSFVKADGIIDVPQNVEGYEAGDEVSVNLKRPLREIEDMLVITGSHDPLIDEISDMLRREDRTIGVASSHVGSMGAIMALRRGEAHLGGIHLLSDDGSYNVQYVKKYFKPGEVVLIEGVKRIQGLIVSKGNPLGLKSPRDVSEKGARFVNRQSGSGTRLLLDYLLKKEAINSADICGYMREELTHTAVAAQIAAGTADCGLGIYAAAAIYGLDFVPIFSEQYDFLVLRDALKLRSVAAFIEKLKSEQFAQRLASLGGYTLDNAGSEKQWN